MALIPIESVSGGIITDIPPYSLPPQVWSQGNNVRFTDNGVENIQGHIEVMLDFEDKPCPIRVKHLVFYNQRDLTDYWLAFGETPVTRSLEGKVYCFDVSSKIWSDVTPAGGLENSESIVWSTTFLGAHLVATNGVDPMIYWPLDYDVNRPDPGNQFIPVDLGLTIAEEEDNVTPQTIDSFKSFLIGTNWSNGPTRIWWSTEGGHYTMPTTWDYLDKDQDAGDYELNDSRGAVIDGAALQDSFLIYKEDSIYIANYVGPPFIFGFKVLSKDVGLLTKNALQEFPGGHVFMSKYDVHVTNGQEVKSILTDKLQSQLFDNLNGDNYHRAFVEADILNNEILICWPSDGSTWCDKCITWNWLTGVLSMRDLPQVSDIEPGVVPLPTAGDEWEVNPHTWSAISRAWGSRAFESVLPELVFAAAGEDKIYRSGVDHTFDGDVMHTRVERTGIDLGDPGSVKRVNAVWPKISVDGGNSVKVYVGSQMSPDHGVTWETGVDFNPDEQSKVSCITTGKYFAFKVESDGDFAWRLHGMEFNVEQAGRRGSRIQ